MASILQKNRAGARHYFPEKLEVPATREVPYPIIQQFLNDESGPTAVKFAVMLALMLLALIGAISAVGSSTSQLWSGNPTKITNARTDPGREPSAGDLHAPRARLVGPRVVICGEVGASGSA